MGGHLGWRAEFRAFHGCCCWSRARAQASHLLALCFPDLSTDFGLMWWDAGNIFICFWLLANSNHPSTAHFQSHELDDIYQWQAWVWLGTEKWPCLSYKDCHRVLWCAGESRAGVGDCILGVIPSPAHPQGSLFWTPYSEHYLWIYNITSTVEATVASSLSNTRHG